LSRIFGDGWDVRGQMPLALGDDSEPEPDVAVVAGSPRDYRDAHPTTAALIVEVADASVAYDRKRKAPLYARAGIPEFWLLVLSEEKLESTATLPPWATAREESSVVATPFRPWLGLTSP